MERLGEIITEMRLVDANALWHKTFTCEDAADVRKEIENAPTVIAEQVVYAEWIDGYGVDQKRNITYKSIDCSNCEGVFKIKPHEDRDPYKEMFKRCPFCGAIMSGGKNETDR